MFTDAGMGGYVAEKAESEKGWLFPVGDEVHELGYTDMFTDMFTAMEKGTQPMENFYDGYVVNAIMDACYKSASTKKWEPVELDDWRGKTGLDDGVAATEYDQHHLLIKHELLPDGRKKVILKHKETGQVSEKLV
jgi:hypothetical protein